MADLYVGSIEANLIVNCISQGDVVFDIGASEGLWSELALSKIPSLRLYLFEPIEECCQKLLSKFDNLISQKKLSVVNTAVSDRKGFRDFYYYPESSYLSTIYKRNELVFELHGRKPPNPAVQIPTISIDDFCSNNGVEHINYLKVDVEGAEFDVIKGAERLLTEQHIDFVEFEYGETYKDAGIKLKEVFGYLRAKGYIIYKVTSNDFFHITSFLPEYEDYEFSTFVALSPNSSFLVKKPVAYKHKKRLPYNRINQIVFEYLHRFSIDTFVETGTYGGGGVCNAMPQAKEIYSIELDDVRYLNAQRLFARFSNVHIIHGDSGKVLPEIMPKLTGRCLFWLDAHYGDDEALGETRTPILDELKCVLKYQDEFIVLIDDARLYTGRGGWPALKTIENIILESYPDGSIEVKDDIIVAIPKKIKPIAQDKFVSMSTLGNYGRFGNQLFQYAALQIYARLNGLRAEVPIDWEGRKLFEGCNDLPISRTVRGQKIPTECIWLNGNCFEGYDIKGYCQYHTSLYAPYKKYFRLLYKFIKPLERVLKDSLPPEQGTLIGIHIRLSDYRLPGRSANIAPKKWYLEWLKQNWDRLNNPTLFLASDEIDNVIEDFREYKPQAYPAGANFLYDFYALSHCDYLLISNSTFSFTAAMLNEQGKEFYRPDFEQKKMVSFEPWDSKPLLEPV